jgi:hypothetical protein
MPKRTKEQHGSARRRTGHGSRSSPVRVEQGADGSELRPFAHPVTDELVLAAAERAERHRRRSEPGVMLGDVFAHMGFLYNGAATRQLRPRLDALVSAGLLERTHRYKVRLLVLTSAGRRSLAQARRRGEVVMLPESPQHRMWRHSREDATEQIGGSRERLRALLDEAEALFDAGTLARSDAWFGLADRLLEASKHVAAAIYCLQEWPEPDDAHPDVDDYGDPGDDKLDPEGRERRRYLRTGRRNIIREEIV